MRTAVVVTSAIAFMSGCAYQLGSPGEGRKVSGIGYDSALAYGDAAETAQSLGVSGQPKGVSMNCAGYLVKPLVAVVGGAALAGASDGHPDQGVAVVAALGAAVLLFSPNCFSALYFVQPAAPTKMPSATVPPSPPGPARPEAIAPPAAAIQPQAPAAQAGPWSDPFK